VKVNTEDEQVRAGSGHAPATDERVRTAGGHVKAESGHVKAQAQVEYVKAEGK
jgi:hypothetical protein